MSARSSQDVAATRGALAGDPGADRLWKRSKREILEAALHLAWLATGKYGDDPAEAIARLEEELGALKKNGNI